MADLSKVDGLLPIHKPKGMVSKDVSRWLVKRFGKLKIGHVGTLDPGASGVLPILLGRATRLQDQLLEQPKSYDFEVTFGAETDTLDSDGTVVKQAPFEHLTETALLDAVQGFIGEIVQTPPIYSAVKYHGKPLYDYARSGAPEAVPLEQLKRRVSISAFELMGFSGAVASFRVTCSKGTYVRSLVKDVADKVGSCGTLTRLVRTSAAGVLLDHTVDLETLERCLEEAASKVLPIEGLSLGMSKWASPRGDLTAKLRSGQLIQIDSSEYFAGVECGESESLGSWARPTLLLNENKRAFGIGSVRRVEAGRIAIQMKRGL